MNDEDMWERLHAILDDETQESIVYVYRLDPDGKLQKPCLFRGDAWPGLLETLNRKYGGGEFKLLIRRGRCMIFSGTILVERWPTAP